MSIAGLFFLDCLPLKITTSFKEADSSSKIIFILKLFFSDSRISKVLYPTNEKTKEVCVS